MNVGWVRFLSLARDWPRVHLSETHILFLPARLVLVDLPVGVAVIYRACWHLVHHRRTEKGKSSSVGYLS
jgi:hypothetical protein